MGSAGAEPLLRGPGSRIRRRLVPAWHLRPGSGGEPSLVRGGQAGSRARRLRAVGAVLELAAGTGLFTRHIAPHATRLIAIDAAASALAINRDRLADDHIEYVQADLFEWEPPDGLRFDAIVFAFLISHAARAVRRVLASARRVARARRSRVLLRRSRGRRTPSVDDRGHRARRPRVRAQAAAHGRAGVHDREGVLRADELEERLAGLGWRADVCTTGREFFYGVASTD